MASIFSKPPDGCDNCVQKRHGKDFKLFRAGYFNDKKKVTRLT